MLTVWVYLKPIQRMHSCPTDVTKVSLHLFLQYLKLSWVCRQQLLQREGEGEFLKVNVWSLREPLFQHILLNICRSWASDTVF